jgi:hypothetical protein
MNDEPKGIKSERGLSTLARHQSRQCGPLGKFDDVYAS